MKILFVHQNFPGQFKHLAPALVAGGHEVLALTMRKLPLPEWQGVKWVTYRARQGSTPGVHPWAVDLETKIIRAEACFTAAAKLKQQGFVPEIILAHPGWGESLFLKKVWPKARMGIYCEFYYHAHGVDMGFDPEFPSPDTGEECRLQLKNLNNLMHFELADAAIAPTHWQASTFPEPFRHKIKVIHDGIDTVAVAPRADASLQLPGGLVLNKANETVTFVNRNLEPYRGYHIFMRALPKLLRRRPQARVLIIGADGVSYGAGPGQGTTWKEVYIKEVRDQINDDDWSRVHFIGQLPYPQFIAALQISTVHIYLTYPFVLSWSLLEAMSAGCAIVASDTQPLHEAIQHDQTGLLVNFFDKAALMDSVCRLLDSPADRARLGTSARQFAQAHYDLKTVCLPRQLEWVASLR